MKLTRKERHEYYKLALEKIKNDQEVFICCALQYFCNREYWDILSNYTSIAETFPEFAKQEPEEKWMDNVWFSTNEKGIKKRINILKKCIKLTKPNGISKRRRVSKRVSISKRSKGNRGRVAVARRVRKKTKTS